jgi:hypothetical protein
VRVQRGQVELEHGLEVLAERRHLAEAQVVAIWGWRERHRMP